MTQMFCGAHTCLLSEGSQTLHRGHNRKPGETPRIGTFVLVSMEMVEIWLVRVHKDQTFV